MQPPNQPKPTPRQSASCLHLVVGAGSAALEHCLSQAIPSDTILFLDAGVLHLLRYTAGSFGEPAPAVHFAAADLHAHGLIEAARRSDVDILDDIGFCELLEAHRHCLTWT